MLEIFLFHQYLEVSRFRVQRTGTAFSWLFTFHVYSLIKGLQCWLGQLNNVLSRSARKNGLTILFSAALVQHAPTWTYSCWSQWLCGPFEYWAFWADWKVKLFGDITKPVRTFNRDLSGFRISSAASHIRAIQIVRPTNQACPNAKSWSRQWF